MSGRHLNGNNVILSVFAILSCNSVFGDIAS